MAEGEIDKLHLDIKVEDDNSAAKINAVAKAINNLQKSLSGLSKVQGQLKALESTLKATSKGLKAPKNTGVNLPNVPTAKLPESTRDKTQIQGIQKGTEASRQYRQEIEKQINATKTLNKEQAKSGDAAKKGASGWSKFTRAVGRIALYRAIRAALKEITKALQEGFQNFVQFDSASNQAMSNVTNSVNQLKNTLGVTMGYLVQTLEPVLVGLSDMAVKLFDNVNMALAAMAGKDKYASAIKGNEDYAKSLKKVNGQLLKFDEFTTLGTGNQETNPKDMFAETEMPEELPETAQMFQDIFETIQTVVKALGEVVEALKPIAVDLLPSIRKIIDVVAKAITKILPLVVKLVEPILSLLEPLIEIVDLLVDILMPVISTIVDEISDALEWVVPAIKAVLKAISSLLKVVTGDWKGAIEDFKQYFVNIWHSIANAFASIINGIANGFITFVNILIDGLNLVLKPLDAIAGIFGGNVEIPHWDAHVNWTPYANGGDFQTGDYFVANENGNTELVASTNSGGSVMNLEQWERISYSSFYRALADYNAAKDNGGSGVNMNQLGRAVASNSGFISEMNRRNSGLRLI